MPKKLYTVPKSFGYYIVSCEYLYLGAIAQHCDKLGLVVCGVGEPEIDDQGQQWLTYIDNAEAHKPLMHTGRYVTETVLIVKLPKGKPISLMEKLADFNLVREVGDMLHNRYNFPLGDQLLD